MASGAAAALEEQSDSRFPDLDRRFHALETRMEAMFLRLENRLLKFVCGILLAQVIAIVGLFGLLVQAT